MNQICRSFYCFLQITKPAQINDCIDKNETSNYIQSLQELFGFEKKDTTPKFEKLKEEPKKIEKTIEPTKSSIYKTKEIQEIFLEKK